MTARGCSEPRGAWWTLTAVLEAVSVHTVGRDRGNAQWS
jgi:hypothetical protein